MSPNGVGGGVIERGTLLQNNDFQTGSLLERGEGGPRSSVFGLRSSVFGLRSSIFGLRSSVLFKIA